MKHRRKIEKNKQKQREQKKKKRKTWKNKEKAKRVRTIQTKNSGVKVQNIAQKTSPYAVAAVFGCTLLISAAQVLWKIGSGGKIALILAGLVIYAISSLILIKALAHGELSVLYPIISLAYVWVTILSIFLLNEHVGILKWIGIGIIIVGVSLVGAGSASSGSASSSGGV